MKKEVFKKFYRYARLLINSREVVGDPFYYSEGKHYAYASWYAGEFDEFVVTAYFSNISQHITLTQFGRPGYYEIVLRSADWNMNRKSY